MGHYTYCIGIIYKIQGLPHFPCQYFQLRKKHKVAIKCTAGITTTCLPGRKLLFQHIKSTPSIGRFYLSPGIQLFETQPVAKQLGQVLTILLNISSANAHICDELVCTN
ncbi:hypothetical protein JTE90_009830 [Oedothorax gibbosus]|uniref:Uncharacterized protein n=1 Tax=Oedothorax gibbosus TaxID=931172 RepID=A0AAV6UDS8_9ARAC|nr:hypothetical protein JTE90_009830 [Oedothorax gibbosus]